jgi:uncharacterized protein (TIGR02996 family)
MMISAMAVAVSPTQAALLRTICLQPWDKVLRLVLADSLEENGQVELATTIRVRCERPSKTVWDLRHMPGTDRLVYECLDILGNAPAIGEFVEKVQCDLSLWYGRAGDGHGPAIVECQPVVRVRLDIENSSEYPREFREMVMKDPCVSSPSNPCKIDHWSKTAIEWARGAAFGPEHRAFTEAR